MSNANGKVRPGWMGGSSDTSVSDSSVSDSSVEEEEQKVDTTPAPGPADEATPEEVYADHGPYEEGAADARQAPVEGEPQQGPARSPENASTIRAEANRSEGHDNASQGTIPDAPSFGKKNMDGAAAPGDNYPYRNETRSAGSATSGIKAAISSFVERISGKRQPAPGGGEIPRSSPSRQKSPEQVEEELKPALRETTIKGFRRIAFGSHEGGVGKSSLAYIVAGAIADCTNLRVCLVDADPNFGSTRYLVPRPVEQSVLNLADDAERLERLADLRTYVSQNEQMGLDILLNPVYAAQISEVPDLAEAYEKVDAVLSRFYDLVVYDLGVGFRDEAIRGVLGLSDELVLVSDAEVIPNAQLTDALRYVEGLGVNLDKTTLAINHGRPPEHESALTTEVRKEYETYVRHVTEVPYDAALSQLLNTRAFHVEKLAQPARLGVLTTASAALEGLRRDAWTDGYEKVLAMQRTLHADQNNGAQKGGR